MLKRATAVAGLVTFALFVSAVPALADGWGYTDCTQYPNPGCQLGAGQGGSGGNGSGNQGGGNNHPSNPGHSNSGSGTDPQNPGDTIIGGNTNLAQCSYVPSPQQWAPPGGGVQQASYVSPTGAGPVTAEPVEYQPGQGTGTVRLVDAQVRLAAAPSPGGAWYIYQCTTGGYHDTLYRPPVWIPNGQPGPAPLPSPAQLAQQALNQLRLPTPKIEANPAGEQLVTLPTWLWLDRGTWGDVAATAAVPGVSVTAVAHPTSVTWSMGDGGSVTCTGPGTPFPTGGNPKSASPDCGYTYHTSSAGQPEQAFPVTATVNWTVTWSGAGQGGTFPNMTTAATVAFRVAESQGITTG